MLAGFIRFIQTPSPIRRRVFAAYGFLLALNVVAWGLTLAAARDYPILLPSAILAYSFGLRHAVDADHIAAIDNTVRKLVRDGQRPIGVGLFFSLGHSTVVIGLSFIIAASAALVANLPTLRSVGALVGTSVSAAFLLLIGLVNLAVLVGIWRMFRRVSAGQGYDVETLEDFLDRRGLLARLLRPVMRLVGHSWQMYPLGILFGLGFDTASEVALLGMAATSAGSGLPVVYIMLLPALFAAGMSLVDTTDGVLMLGAYGWASVKPIRKLYYNLNITLVSVIIAFGVGGLELANLVGTGFGLSGGVWDLAARIDFGSLGLAIIAVFAASWLTSALIYRWKGYDRLGDSDEQPDATPERSGS
jgi:high-affinity nickel-transport protein